MNEQSVKTVVDASVEDRDFQVAMLEEGLVHRVARRVREFRKTKGLSQQALAEMLNTQQPRVALIEAGESNLTLRSLAELAYCLDRFAEDFVVERAVYRRTEPWGQPTLTVLGGGQSDAGVRVTYGQASKLEKAAV